MDNLPRQKLCEIISKYGNSIYNDTRRVEGLLRDFCGGYKREIHTLVSALRERVPQELLNSTNTGITEKVVIARLSKRLQDDLAMNEDAARWAVESWALALGVITAADVGKVAVHQAIQNPTPQPIKPTPQPPINATAAMLPGGVKIEFVKIPAGKFMMGSEKYDDLHEVTITKSFYMGKYQVTQAQWQAVMGNNPSYFKDCDNCPVEGVSWDDVQEFIKKLNAQNDGYKYRLPTEAEWEYACRAGTTGDYAGNLDEMAWYNKNSGSKTHPVGTKKPNAWGLYDMHGNVWEWCQDWYGDYPSSAVTDPTGPSSGSDRVNRGGSWDDSGVYLRSASRGGYSPTTRGSILGFRLIRTL